MAQERPNPDELLARVQAEEQQQTRGKLKIFLGYAAGVGKTYAMLEAAHQRQAEGIDLAVGYVETHGRAETEAILRGLELVPRRQVEYHNVVLPEMDMDALLARCPQLALVDELAHTNAPGSRHPKRYQDVQELLAAGIDVYTTLNIQHLESLNDAVAQITGVIVHETIPDSIIDQTTEIELIDLPPDELLQRLKEGKVYVPEQAARAIEKFFRTGNLTALREMTLRRAAERIDDQMRAYMRTRSIPGPWPAHERLLVCVSPSPLAERLVRTTRRLADELDARWTAIYIETAGHTRLSPADKERVARTLQLAESLGGQVTTKVGRSMPETALAYARKHNMTKIIVGKPVRPRWREWLRGSLVDQLIRSSGPIDVYVISDRPEAARATPQEMSALQPHRPWRRYLQSLLLVVGGTLASALVHPLFTPVNLVMIYLLIVVLAAIYLGRGPSLLAAMLSVAAFDFFFVPPHFTFAVSDTQYLLTFAALLIVGLVISDLTARAREQADMAQQHESQTSELYALSRDLAASVGLDAILQAVLAHIGLTFSRRAGILLPDAVGADSREEIKLRASSPGFTLDQHRLAVAMWAFEHSQPAGRGTDTLPAADLRCLPLKTARGVVGVLGLDPSGADWPMTPDERNLLDAFANQAALAIERAQLAEQAQHARLLQETEKLQTTLLNMISHDLRTPLVSIIGALSGLQEKEVELDTATRNGLVENAREEAERLNRLVGNLLSMTRIESGALRVMCEPTDIQDVIGVALEQLGDRLPASRVFVQALDELPLVPMDFVLIAQVLVNLLDNAMKHSAADAPIEIAAHPAGAFLEIEVRDRGVGIPRQDLKRVFDKFYRVQRPDSVSGTGLGLAICKGIIEAHGGFIVAENRPGGGTVITFALPFQEKAA